MIVAFFLLYCYSASAWKYVKKTFFTSIFESKSTNSNDEISDFGNWIFDLPDLRAVSEISDDKISFRPPVYEQRYWTTAEILKKVGSSTTIKKVADLGCSEMQFFLYLKQMAGLEEILFVDVDEDVLERYACRTRPYPTDFLDRRETPLKIFVLNGDVSVPDKKLEGTDAVVAIELIEHLYPKALEDLPYAIFGLIQPDIALFTTPNCEFNVVFPNFSGFRHIDHKFEWDRSQFRDWACNLALRYPEYEVYFKGIGPGPQGTEKFGHCSQMAVFCRKSKALNKMDKSNEFDAEYKVIDESDFPVKVETRTREEIIRDEAEMFINRIRIKEEFLINDKIEIPLKMIIESIPKMCTFDELREVLSKANWKIEKLASDEFAVIVPEFDANSEYCSNNSEVNDLEGSEEVILSNYKKEECWDENWLDPLPDGSRRDCGKVWEIGEVGHFGNGHIDQEEVQWPVSSSVPEVPELPVQFFPRCRSFEQIQKRDVDVNKNKSFRFSFCEENRLCACDSLGAKNVVCSGEREISMEEIASGGSEVFCCLEDSRSGSKAVDSGYPNSVERDMETDLTPEQVEEIATESESSFDEGDEEESVNEDAAPPPRAPPRHHNRGGGGGGWVDAMENGDVANNNRDWEGNNAEAEAPGQPLQFENVIDHLDFALPLNDAALPLPEPDSDDENRFVSAIDYFSGLDDTLVGSQDSSSNTPRHSFEPLAAGLSLNRCLPLSDSFKKMESEHLVEEANSDGPPSDPSQLFPSWLLNISINDDDMQVDDILQRNIPLESLEEETELVATVEGDVLGGGEPLAHN